MWTPACSTLGNGSAGGSVRREPAQCSCGEDHYRSHWKTRSVRHGAASQRVTALHYRAVLREPPEGASLCAPCCTAAAADARLCECGSAWGVATATRPLIRRGALAQAPWRSLATRSRSRSQRGRIRALEYQLRNLKRQWNGEDGGNDGDCKRKAATNDTDVIKKGELTGMPYFWKGKALCFGFNSSRGCKEKNISRGAKCANGFHVCGTCGSAGCKFIACSVKPE